MMTSGCSYRLSLQFIVAFFCLSYSFTAATAYLHILWITKARCQPLTAFVVLSLHQLGDSVPTTNLLS